jgi:D-alanine--poly(phosphoribitol) ligase subunit 2
MMINENEIARLILEEVLSGSDITRINPDDSLISSGILDSLALLRLVVVIESRYGVEVQDGELIPDNFETVNKIKAYLETK